MRQPTFPSMRQKASSPETVILLLLALLVAAGIAFGGAGAAPDDPAAGARAAAAEVAPIARRVEQVRGLRFERLPEPLIVTPAAARRDALADVDRNKASEIQAAARASELLGLLPPRTDLRAVEGGLYDQQVLGYYDPRRKRLAIVAGSTASDDVTSEITLAHELDHADDDQHFGLDRKPPVGADDASLAFSALVEGTATSVMTDYARRFISAGDTLKSALASLSASSSTDSIPPYLLNSLLFTYLSGQKFVDRLRSVGGGWKLVNYAFSKRPPASSEQVIHPEKYLVNERPVRVRLPAVGDSGLRRTAAGTFGEFDTDQLLRLGVDAGEAGDAAAGWGGGRYEMWGQDVLVVGWAWDTPGDAAQAGAALRKYVGQQRPGDAAAVREAGLRTALVIAPDSATASRLAARAVRR
jgi:hypothetical protein